jgi:hypothetical protein
VYDAPNLESKRASVNLRGMGRAYVWAVDDLDTSIRGFGGVEYRGTPHVRKDGPPLPPVPGLGKV